MRAPVSSSRNRAVFAGLILAAATAGCASSGAAPPPEPLTPASSAGAVEETAASDLDARIQVGYGTSSRREITSAVGSVTGCDIATSRVTRLEDLLQGRVAGVAVMRNTSGGMSVRVRGAQSLYGDAEPLFVVDGMPLLSGGQLAGIAPQDVDRIDVLKDAGATAIYGSRGANGVIVITTKRGTHAQATPATCNDG